MNTGNDIAAEALGKINSRVAVCLRTDRRNIPGRKVSHASPWTGHGPCHGADFQCAIRARRTGAVRKHFPAVPVFPCARRTRRTRAVRKHFPVTVSFLPRSAPPPRHAFLHPFLHPFCACTICTIPLLIKNISTPYIGGGYRV